MSKQAVCLRGMAKEPSERFASIAEFAAALGQCLGECPDVADEPEPTESNDDLPPTKMGVVLPVPDSSFDFETHGGDNLPTLDRPAKQRQQRAIIFAAAGIVVIASIVIWLLTRDRNAPNPAAKPNPNEQVTPPGKTDRLTAGSNWEGTFKSCRRSRTTAATWS